MGLVEFERLAVAEDGPSSDWKVQCYSARTPEISHYLEVAQLVLMPEAVFASLKATEEAIL